MNFRQVTRFAIGAMGAILAAGCSGDKVASEVASKNTSNIQRVANLYSGYQYMHAWQGPKDEQALKDFVKNGFPEQNLKLMGIDRDNLDALFISERDGKPFKIRSGVGGGGGSTNALVFEQEGVNGKRLVGFNAGVVEEVEEPRYTELWEHGGAPSGLTVTGGAPPPMPSAASTSAATTSEAQK